MKINGQTFSYMCISAANALDRNQDVINNLNVFPVPDGDTGINMYLTMSTVRELRDFEGTLSQCADKVAGMLLRGARGNSGAILSLFFRGFSKALKGLDEADGENIAAAFVKGTEEAYKAVMNPTEGTILTVMRLCAERSVKLAAKKYKNDIPGLFGSLVDTAKFALSQTPELLPILKEAKVVDAGGSGFVTVLEGMEAALLGDPVKMSEEIVRQTEPEADFSLFLTEEITFAYCTECIIGKDDAFLGEDKALDLRDFLAGLGDSLVFAEDDDIVKIHVHTNKPGLVLEEGLKYGRLEKVKIENMRLQHTALSGEKMPAAKPEAEAEIFKDYGFLSVCIGDGIRDAFRDLGVDEIVYGGQTMNPSTQDILSALDTIHAETVFVLPNNKNIHMVAAAAADLAVGKAVIVLPTRSVPEGISAMIAFDASLDAEANKAQMEEAIAAVTTVTTTVAVRDTTLDGRDIKAGETLCLVNGKIASVADGNENALLAVSDSIKGGSYISVFYGEDASDAEAEAISEKIRAMAPDAEVVLIPGGQPIYPYIISVE